MKRWLLFISLISMLVVSFVVPVGHDTITYASSCQGVKVLFDNAHGETAGNADWTIEGAYSDFADALKQEGMTVAQWGNTECRRCGEDDDPITYNVLKQYDVYILPEPNVNLTPREKAAILMFIRNGGGVLFMGDHWGSDRNNDGWDSVEIINGFTQWMATDKNIDVDKQYIYDKDFAGRLGFRYTFEGTDDDNITNFMKGHPIVEGLTKVGSWGGGVIRNLGFGNANSVIWYNSSPKDVYLIAGFYYKGRFASIGDSGVFDDGTGAPGDKLYDGWHYGSDAQMGINTVKWLSGCLPEGPRFMGKRVFLYIGDNHIVKYDGKTAALEKVTIDASPFINPLYSRTVVPLRFVADALGLNVDWYEQNRSVIIEGTLGDTNKYLEIPFVKKPKKYVENVNGVKKEIYEVGTVVYVDGKPMDIKQQGYGSFVVVDGRTYAPIRVIAELFGTDVKWRARQKTVIITVDK